MVCLRQGIQELATLDNVRLASILVILFAETFCVGSEHGQGAGPPRQNPATDLGPVLDELMIGCGQDGAIKYLLQKGGYRLERVNVNHEDSHTKPADDYDEALVLQLGSRSEKALSSGTVCLYFRGGFLAYKCGVSEENINLRKVFRREITSGAQHPLNHLGLMDRIQWGRPTEPRSEEVAADTFERVEQPTVSLVSRQQLEWPKVRCGIAVKGLPAFAMQRGYNLLVVYQNMGPTDLNDEMLLGYPANPGIMVTATYADHDQSIGFPGNFGIYGPKAYRWRDGETAKDVRRAAFRLKPGEATYMWFQVPNLESCLSLQARTIWLRGATEQGKHLIIRDWDADSPEITTARPVRTCSGITE